MSFSCIHFTVYYYLTSKCICILISLFAAFSPFILESIEPGIDTGKKKVKVSPYATIANSVRIYLVPNVILYGWIRRNPDGLKVWKSLNFRANETRW